MIDAVHLIVAEFVVLAVLCGYLIHHYKSPLVTVDCTTTVYVCWVFGLAAVLLLPYDLSSALVAEDHNNSLVHLWSWVYWSTFFLAWVVLPIQMEYHNSGHFSFRDKKLITAAMVALFAGLVYVIYMVSTSRGSFSQVLGFTMAMGNTYGVLLITVLMGSGLAGLPKRLWAMSDSHAELQRLYLLAGPVEEAYQEARYQLEDCELEVKAASDALSGAQSSAGEIGEYAEVLRNKVANFAFAGRSSSRAYGKTHALPQRNYREKRELVGLHQRLITAQLKARASEQRWRYLVSQCKIYQNALNENMSNEEAESSCFAPIDSNSAHNENGGPAASLSMKVQRSLLTGYRHAYIIWIRRFYSVSLKAAAIFFGVCSCLILWSEMVMSTRLRSPIGYLMGAYSPHTDATVVQAMSFLALCYMSVCTYWTLFRMNIGWSYRLMAPQLSPPSSLIFNGEYLSRLQFSIGYNFLLILNDKRTSSVAFSSLMENIEIVPVFGTSFTVYVPIIMSVIALVTLFDGFAMLLKLLGIETEESLTSTGPCGLLRRRDEMDTELLEKCKSGEMIIANELRQIDIAHQALRKQRSSNFTERDMSTHSAKSATSSSAPIHAPHTHTAHTTHKGFMNTLKESVSVTVGALGSAKYANLDSTKPRSMVDDEDEDEEALSPSGSRLAQRQRQREREEELGESIFVSTLSSNLDFSASPPRSRSAFSPSSTAVRKPSSSSSASSTSVFAAGKVQQNSKKVKNFFEFDDEPEDPLDAFRGRYSNV